MQYFNEDFINRIWSYLYYHQSSCFRYCCDLSNYCALDVSNTLKIKVVMFFYFNFVDVVDNQHTFVIF